jgi:hypothetical protein
MVYDTLITGQVLVSTIPSSGLSGAPFIKLFKPTELIGWVPLESGVNWHVPLVGGRFAFPRIMNRSAGPTSKRRELCSVEFVHALALLGVKLDAVQDMCWLSGRRG